MKSKIRMLIILVALIISSVIFGKQISAQQSYVSFQVFYDQLSPYGQWVEYPNYGYVWIPDAGPDFVPYSTMGHWIFTDYGWTWVSNYEWGWAPFHYGRWDFDNYYGWFWVPDNEWGPAWVSWRRAEGYYGWEPMGPGISISVSFGRDYDRQNDHWIFVRDRDIDRSDINHYYVSRDDHDRIVRNSKVINNTYVDNRRNTTYITGPDRNDFQKAAGRSVNQVTIQEYNKPGQELNNGQFRIYKPQVTKNNDMGQKSAPARVANLKDVKRPSERKAANQSGNTVKPEITKQEQQSNPARQQNTAKPVQKQNANAAGNTTRVPQQKTAKPQNQVKPQVNDAKPVQKQSADPSQNTAKVPQQNTVKQQNNPVKPVQQQTANPQRNNTKTETVKSAKTAGPERRTVTQQPKKSETAKDKPKKD